MDNNRKLPIHEMRGSKWIIDVDNKEFREMTNPENIIPFQEMNYRGTHYLLDFDCYKNTLRNMHTRAKHLETVEVPQIKDLDPLGVAIKYGKPLEEVKKSTDFLIMVDQEKLTKRLDNHMPTIEIYGHQFTVNLVAGALIPQGYPLNQGIPLPNDFEKDHKLIRKLYDPRTFKAVDTARKITEIPENLIMIEFPGPHLLDPVGWFAQHFHRNLDDLKKEQSIQKLFMEHLMKCSIGPDPTAKILTLEQGPITELVQSNKEKGMPNKTHKDDELTITPDKKNNPKKGMGF